MGGTSGEPGRRAFLAAVAAAVAGVCATAAALDRRSGPVPPARLVLATGPEGAVFVDVGHDLARAVRATSPGTAVTSLVTAATVQNLHLLADGAADLGFASLDAAAVDPLVQRGSITAIGRLYDSLLQLVVPAASPIRVLADCTGRRVSVGAAGSGTEFTVLRLLRLSGVRPAQLVRLAQSDAMDALARGDVEAAFSLTGFPTPAISMLAQREQLRLIPLADAEPALEAGIPRVYAPADLPEGTYPGIGAIPTLLVPNVLLARPGLSDPAVTLVTRALFDPASRRFWTDPDSRRIDVRTAIATGPVTLHPAAVRWFRANKP